MAIKPQVQDDCHQLLIEFVLRKLFVRSTVRSTYITSHQPRIARLLCVTCGIEALRRPLSKRTQIAGVQIALRDKHQDFKAIEQSARNRAAIVDLIVHIYRYKFINFIGA